MSDSANTPAPSHGNSQSNGSMGRLVKAILPILAIALLVYYTTSGLERKEQLKHETDMLARLLGNTLQEPADQIEFADADGDLLCDPPADATAPEKLIFSYIASPEPGEDPETWQTVLDKLAEATGLPVEYKHYESVNDQLGAMARGELHLAGLNTGAVPIAVRAAGFWPVCTFGNEDGTFGYTMQLITPADSSIKKLDQLRGKRIAFTRPDSNSGFKAALVTLMTDVNLQPERDYQWGFTFDHETSIRDIASGSKEYDAAPVASDIVDRMVAEGEVAEGTYSILYESERFPPATLGFSYNLPEALRTQISETLLGFEWPESTIETKYGSSGAVKFVPVTYKDDWANIRRIDEAVRQAKSGNVKR